MDSNLSGILIIIAIIFVSLLLCFLRCHLNRRRLPSNPTAPPPPPPPPPPIIDRLPLFRFSSISRGSSSVDGDCAICLERFRNIDMLCSLPCAHAFHAECVNEWFNSNETCPLCRTVVSASDADLAAILQPPSFDSITVHIGNVSLRRGTADLEAGDGDASYSLGSHDYRVTEPSEVPLSATASFGSSRRFQDIYRNGEEISEIFGALSPYN